MSMPTPQDEIILSFLVPILYMGINSIRLCLELLGTFLLRFRGRASVMAFPVRDWERDITNYFN
ncbi:hypothetical protein Anacy_0076 [Anabaena cylindrica PCC 7122]|uniref:Uncharacterized protein n=1 Tax=Anabaena cylindrica (strain ATCC 27899 / PCC 7122) TaxID=272123 RepID=K9ZAF6_ANACC|nr:hypothetical protein Anacy_0076 [Anabaena cylindrica PCC 7122]BAY01896.1 hypothetical protein NIES19_11320 [Anabaena cylindrica PCC 7122]